MSWPKDRSEYFFRLTEEYYLSKNSTILSLKGNHSIYIGENNIKYYLFDMISAYPEKYVFGPEERHRRAIALLRKYLVEIGIIQESERLKFICNKRSHNVGGDSTNSGRYGIEEPSYERWITKEDIDILKKQFNKSSISTQSKQADDIKQFFQDNYAIPTVEKNTAETLLNNHWESLISSRPKFDTTYVSRTGLQKSFEKWISSDEKVLLISGNFGMGKTTFITQQILNGYIKNECVYFCRRLYPSTVKPITLLRSLIYAIYLNSENYRNLLNDNDYSDQLFHADTIDEMIETLNRGLHKVKDINEFIFVVDGVDETHLNEKNSIVQLLQKYITKFPLWLRFICTTREIPEIMYRLKRIANQHISISDSDKEDTRQYYYKRLHYKNIPEYEFNQILDMLVDKGDGSFLYARLLCDEIDDGKQSIYDLHLPEGLEDMYIQYLDEYIGGQEDFDNSLKPLLNLVCAYNGIITIDILLDILNDKLLQDKNDIDNEDIYEDDIKKQFERISSLFQISDFGEIIPIHINVLEFFENINRSVYRVNIKKGHKLLSKYCRKHIDDQYSYYYMITHMILSGMMFDDAENMLSDINYFHKRQEHMGLEEYSIKYLSELKIFNEKTKEKSYLNKIMEGDAFIEFVSENRDFLYHHGLLYNLKDCGIDMVIGNDLKLWVKSQKEKDNNKLLAFWTVYFYRLRSQLECKELILSLGDLSFIEDIFIRVEILNWLGVCEMKQFLFNESLSTFQAIEDILYENKDYLDYDEQSQKIAFSAVNCGKVLTQQQGDNWKSNSINYFKKAVDLLDAQAKKASTFSQKKIAELILAEYCATSASYLIWTQQDTNYNGNDIAGMFINKAQEIYETYHNKDQWYIRFCFIKALYEGFNGDLDIAYKYLAEAEDLKPHPYEKAHVYLVEAVLDYIYSGTVKNRNLLVEAKDNALMYQGFLEFEEINALWTLLGNKAFENPYGDKYTPPDKWIEYFINMVIKLHKQKQM